MLSRIASTISDPDGLLLSVFPVRWIVRVAMIFSPGRLVTVLRMELRLRRDERLLMTMSDHELSDLGIGRGQVRGAVRYGRRSSFRSGADY
jgi:uncharacterized protein YjiS (DUF1127 family)